VNSLVPFEPYIHQVKARIGAEYYSFPLNLNTFKKVWSIEDSEEAYAYFLSQTRPGERASNIEEKGRSELGDQIFEMFIKGYTEKQWARPASDLPASILARVPVRTDENDNYFLDRYQGLPRGGYNHLINKLLEGTEYVLDSDFLKEKQYWEEKGERIVFTGCIDQLFDYRFGNLDYRSLRFENERIETEYYQPVSVVNYPEVSVPFTRVVEHKHFHNQIAPHTIITKEYPEEFNRQNEPYYPVVDDINKERYARYKAIIPADKYILGGRLAEYKYYDMHQVIASAIKAAKVEFSESVA
jgi:UDP-galactopyranose mutase